MLKWHHRLHESSSLSSQQADLSFYLAMDQPRSSLLMPLCATGGAVAVLSSAGLVPALGLALGLGGGWLLGQRLKGKKPLPAGAADSESESEEEAIQELGEFMGAECFGRFMQRLQQQDVAEERVDGPEVKKIQEALHGAFDRMPRERLAELLLFFMPREKTPPTLEELDRFQRLCEEVQSLMPQEARECMEKTNSNFLEHVLRTMPGADIRPPSQAQVS